MPTLDEAWARYWAASYAQMDAVAAMADIPDINDIEQQIRANDESR